MKDVSLLYSFIRSVIAALRNLDVEGDCFDRASYHSPLFLAVIENCRSEKGGKGRKLKRLSEEGLLVFVRKKRED